MFDRLNVRVESPRVPSHVTVHEHRAPTDESVKLLKELEEKALSKILECYELRNNLFSCMWYAMEEPLGVHLVMHMKINGKEIIARTTIPAYQWLTSELQDRVQIVYKQCFEAITDEATKQISNSTEAVNLLQRVLSRR